MVLLMIHKSNGINTVKIRQFIVEQDVKKTK